MSDFSHPFVPTPGSDRGPVVGVSATFDPGYVISAHVHDRAQLVYAAKGVMTVTTSQGTWVVPPQRAVWVPAGISHSITMTGQVDMRTCYIDPGHQPAGFEGCCVVNVSPLLRALILATGDIDRPYPDGSREDLLTRLLLAETKSAPVQPMHLPLPQDPRLDALSKHLQADPSDSRSLHEWSRSLGASERTLSRLFLKETGMTFGHWRQQLRLLRALQLLATGTSVTTTALEVGYDSTSAFVSMFRTQLGDTPGRYFSARRPSGRTA